MIGIILIERLRIKKWILRSTVQDYEYSTQKLRDSFFSAFPGTLDIQHTKRFSNIIISEHE